MKRWIAYAALGLVAFAGFAIASAPARLVYDAAARPAGIEAGLVSGTVWNASLRRVRVGGLSLTQVEARLRPGPLLTGRAALDLVVTDPALRASGRVTLTPGGTLVQDATGVMGLDAVPALAAADLPPGQSARIVIDRLELAPDGACREAIGQVSSAVLVAAGEQYGAALPALPVLNAELACAGDTVALNFSGQSDALALTGQVRLLASGPQWRIVADTAERDLIGALSLMGFDQDGDRFVAEGGS